MILVKIDKKNAAKMADRLGRMWLKQGGPLLELHRSMAKELRREPLKPMAYMAHPVSPIEDETIESNLTAAKRWLKVLTESRPDLVFVAPWIMGCEIWDDADPEMRVIGLAHCHQVIRRCDEFWMVGPRMSGGMDGERNVALESGCLAYDFTCVEITEFDWEHRPE